MIDQGLLGSVSLSIAANILLGGESRGTGYFSILLVLKTQPSAISFSISLDRLHRAGRGSAPASFW